MYRLNQCRSSTETFRVRCVVTCQLDKDCLRNLLFGDYLMPDREPDERVYEEVKSIDQFHQIVETYLEEYNNVHKAHMNLVIFRYFLYSLFRVSIRIKLQT